MNKMKKLLSFVLLLMTTTGAWALEQDGEGYYLIGTAQDWQDFATLVQTTPTANARMTADIDLGSSFGSEVSKLMIGTSAVPYQGTFDGQGHVVDFSWSGYLASYAPFYSINGATIKNLASVGKLTGGNVTGAGLVYSVTGTGNVIERCYVSATIPVMNGWQGADLMIIYDNAEVSVKDCLSRDISYQPAIYCRGAYTLTVENSLLVSTVSVNTQALSYTNVNSFMLGWNSRADDMTNGTIATALQNGRAETVWVQDPITNQPMLALFANTGLKANAHDGLYWATYYCGTAGHRIADGENACAYTATYSEGTLTLHKLGKVIPAGTAVIVVGSDNDVTMEIDNV